MKLGEFERTPIELTKTTWFYPERKRFRFYLDGAVKTESITVSTKLLRRALQRVACEAKRLEKIRTAKRHAQKKARKR